MTDFFKQRNEKLGQKVVEALQKRHFEAYFCKSKEDALKQALELIPHNHTISWGGSMSISEIGLTSALKSNNYNIIDRDSAKNPEEKKELTRNALFADTFLLSANAISEDGQLVNIDGTGNRIAALAFGPSNVIVIAGMNKVVKTLDDAVERARTIAAPVNMQRIASMIERKTPCAINGSCANCTSEDSICSHIIITRLCSPKNRIKVILVGENLGY